jgi:hypothetical protein
MHIGEIKVKCAQKQIKVTSSWELLNMLFQKRVEKIKNITTTKMFAFWVKKRFKKKQFSNKSRIAGNFGTVSY